MRLTPRKEFLPPSTHGATLKPSPTSSPIPQCCHLLLYVHPTTEDAAAGGRQELPSPQPSRVVSCRERPTHRGQATCTFCAPTSQLVGRLSPSAAETTGASWGGGSSALRLSTAFLSHPGGGQPSRGDAGGGLPSLSQTPSKMLVTSQRGSGLPV